MTIPRTTALTAAAAVAVVALSGCGQLKSTPASPPPCPASVRTAGGDLVPPGARPCVLSTPKPTPSRSVSTGRLHDRQPDAAAPSPSSAAPNKPTAPKIPAAKTPATPKRPAAPKQEAPRAKAPAAPPKAAPPARRR
ncbi:hypothetical protein [Streptomyces sp. NBC_01601]|uniref:hypothetical protein n=1 Tax=Streptomyces sp. NBC_01601 TaxID=2975892 RepID=UPI002E2A7FA2|nr:hypothetical protein [Streptomyces sp. NBC_01601]